MSAPHQNEETESSTWASTTSILHLNDKITRKWKAWEEKQCVLKRKKGCIIKHV